MKLKNMPSGTFSAQETCVCPNTGTEKNNVKYLFLIKYHFLITNPKTL